MRQTFHMQDSLEGSYHQILVFPVLSSEEKSDGPGEMAFLRAVGVKSFQATSRGSVLFIEGGVKFFESPTFFSSR